MVWSSIINRKKLSVFRPQVYLQNGQASINQIQREWRGGKRRKQVFFFTGRSMPLSRLLHSLVNCNRYRSCCQIPRLLSHPSWICHLQEELPLKGSSFIDYRDLGFVGRGFCSLSETESEIDCDGEGDGEIGVGSVDSEVVDRVCKVIDELFALDRSMEAVLDECGIEVSHNLVVKVLERFQHGWKPAFRFFCWAGQRPGFDHDSRTYSAIMSILAKSRQFETMMVILEEMGGKSVLSMDVFLIAMRAFAAAKERKKAVGVIELMKKYEFGVGVETINSLLDSLGRAKLVKEAHVLFGKLEDRFKPNMRTYTVLLNGWCKVKNLMEAGKVWNEMIDSGFKPDIVAHNVMLEGLLKSNKKSDAIKLFTVMKAKGPSPDVHSYTILIRDLCKQRKMEEAVEYFDEMIDSRHQPDAAVYTCLITGFGNAKRLDMVHDLLKEMKNRGCPPDGRTYNALIKLMTNQKMPDDAVTIYKKMIQSGIQPTIHTYNMIMKSYFRIRNYEMGHEVWSEMKRKGCCPDDNSYTILIGAFISEGRCREACKYLFNMMDKGMKAPLLDYNKVAAGLSRAGERDMLDVLARRMNLSGNFGAFNTFARWADTMKNKVKRNDFPVDGQYTEYAEDTKHQCSYEFADS